MKIDKYLPKNIKVRRLVVFFSLLTLFLIFFYFNPFGVKEEESLSKAVKTGFCQKNEDCQLAVRLDRCCVCPEAKTRAEIEADPALVVYQSGRDYYSHKTADCSRAECGPCPFMNSVECVDSLCRTRVLTQVEMQTISWQTFRQTKFGFQIKYPPASRFFEEKDRFTFRYIDVDQPITNTGVDSFYLQIFHSGEAGDQLPEGLAQKALKMELELVEKYGGNKNDCQLTLINRGGLSGYRVNFCSKLKDDSVNIPEFTEWYVLQGRILEVSGRVIHRSAQEIFDLMLATLTFFPTGNPKY